jgi:tripartite-type tricarboxylate transporter receptor subunit TctC
MTKIRVETLTCTTAALVCALLWAPAGAQTVDASYPSRPIRIINASPAGGSVDAATRIVADELQKLWGHPVTVENRTGGSHNIAGEAVSKSDPDGYTLLATPPGTLTANAVLFRRLSYDPSALQPVAIMALAPNVLAVKKDLPVKSVAELIAHAKTNPGKLTYASQGNGSTTHLTAELFLSRTGTKLVHVPYRGTAPALTDLAGGHVDMMFCDLGSIVSLHQAGSVRIIAAGTQNRLPELPAIPSMDESGIKGLSLTTFFALVAPPGTPAAIRAKLNKAIVTAMQSPNVRAKLNASYLEPSTFDIGQMGDFIRSEAELWGGVIRAANITVDQ